MNPKVTTKSTADILKKIRACYLGIFFFTNANDIKKISLTYLSTLKLVILYPMKMDPLTLTKLMKDFRIKFKTKTSNSNKCYPAKNTKASLEYLPYEILDKIFKDFPKQEVMRYRLISSSLRLKIDHLYSRDFTMILNENAKPLFKISFEVTTLIVRKLVSSAISKEFVSQNFSNSVNKLEITDCISPQNLKRLLRNLPCLQVLNLNSMVLGGTSKLQRDLQFTLGPLGIHSSQEYINAQTLQSKKEKWIPLALKEMNLRFDYVPPSCKIFSSTSLITNLLEIHAWNTPKLQTMTFTVELSPLSEQFYFSLDMILLSIPLKSYESLKVLKIIAPKLRSVNSHTNSRLFKKDLERIQLKQFELQITNKNAKYAILSELFLGLFNSQKQLEIIILNIQKPSSESLISTIKNNNPNLRDVRLNADQ